MISDDEKCVIRANCMRGNQGLQPRKMPVPPLIGEHVKNEMSSVFYNVHRLIFWQLLLSNTFNMPEHYYYKLKKIRAEFVKGRMVEDKIHTLRVHAIPQISK